MYFITDLWYFFTTSRWLLLEDAVEIIIFYFFIHSISGWLARTNNRFLLYFYAYLTILIIASLVSWTGIYSLLIYSGPFLGIFFIVFHQERLQKNFVALNKITFDQKTVTLSNQWPELLMRGLLYAMNKEKSVVCVLEYAEPLPLVVQHMIEAPLSLSLLTMIVDSTLFDQHKTLWLRKQMLIGFNSSLVWNKTFSMLEPAVEHADNWIQDGLIITKKTDALIVRVDHKTRLFDLVCQGKLLEKVSSQTALSIIKKYSHLQPMQKETSYMRNEDVFKYLQS